MGHGVYSEMIKCVLKLPLKYPQLTRRNSELLGFFALIDFCLILYNLVCLSSKGDFLYLLFFSFKKKVLNESGREFKWNKENTVTLLK